MFKKLSIFAIALFLLGGSTLAFAWWDNLEDTEEDVEVGVGEGVTLTVDLEEQTEGDLVPEGVVMKEDDITEVDVDFTVTLDQDDLVDPLNLNVDITDKEVGGDADGADLVNAAIDQPETIQNEDEDVVITVSLDEPENEDEYDAIAKQDITFDVEFEATQQD